MQESWVVFGTQASVDLLAISAKLRPQGLDTLKNKAVCKIFGKF